MPAELVEKTPASAAETTPDRAERDLVFWARKQMYFGIFPSAGHRFWDTIFDGENGNLGTLLIQKHSLHDTISR